jgi:hypothetical protein
MNTPALDILGYLSVFSGTASFYTKDSITFTLENGTVIGPNPWLAAYYSPGDTGPLETGGDFYNYFVLGLIPPSADADDDNSDTPSDPSPDAGNSTVSASNTTNTDSADSAMPTSWDNPAYPDNPDVVQDDLATNGGGFVTGYFLNDTSVGVISIPSFQEFGDAIGTFSDTVSDFLVRSKAAGLKKIVIDLQQNNGGDALLAFDTFKHFFPDLEPFGGSRMRAHHMANILGHTINGYWDKLNTTQFDYYALIVNEWVATDRLKAATGKNFSSWGDFFGPHKFHDDAFTATVCSAKKRNVRLLLTFLAATSQSIKRSVRC